MNAVAVRNVVAAAVIGAAVAGAPISARTETGYDLLSKCKIAARDYANTASDGFDAGYCMGFISGVYPADTSCGPDALQRGQAIMIYVNWANRHPRSLHVSASVAVSAAFGEAFPCATEPQPHVSRIPNSKAPDVMLPTTRR